MDKNQQNLKMEELKTAMYNRDYEKAVDIAGAFDLKRIKDNNFLCLVADAYEISHRYQEAKKALLIAYENTNAGRQLAYRLCLISIKTNEFSEAKEFYKDFVEMAPRDTTRYILKYKMAKAQNAPIEKLIRILEEYVNIDMEEKWAYELAKLYHIAGNREKCVDMCNEICLWFSEGKYVAKAIELKGGRNADYVKDTSLPEEDEIPENLENHIEDEENLQELEELQEIEEDILKESINPDEVQEITGIIDEIEDVEVLEEIDDADLENVEKRDATDVDAIEDVEEMDTLMEIESDMKDEIASEPEKEDDTEVEPIKDIQGVEDILRQLQARGILKAETVAQAVNIIDEAGKSNRAETQNSVSTFERWEEDSAEPTDDVLEEELEDSISEDEVLEDTLDENTVKDTFEDEVIGETVKEQVQIDSIEEQILESAEIKETIEVEESVANFDKSEITEHTAEIKVTKNPIVDGVPVFNLDFEASQTSVINESKDTEQQEVDIQDEEVSVSGVNESEFTSDKQLSVNVEIISGTDWKQDETTKKQPQNLIIADVDNKNTEINVEKAATQRFELPIKRTENIVAERQDTEKESLVLTEEELSTFKNYLNVEGFATNIKDVLQELIVNYTPNGKSTDGNVIIMGSEKTGKTTLAIETIRLVNKKRGRRNRKLAKIDASALNKRGFRSSLNRLLGSDLIIENAHILGAMTLSEIIDVTGMYTDDMLIVLEGETDQMEKMLSESTRLSGVFNHVIRIREYDIKEWVEYGKRYAIEQGYNLDELANLAFYKAIDDFFGTNKGIGQEDVETIVDEAISRSKRFGRKLSGMFSSKKDEEGLYTLVESDFNVK